MNKKFYRVRNWREYNKALMKRGSLTFWFSEEVITHWRDDGRGVCHGNQQYSGIVIACALTLRQLFRIPLRATTGMMRSLVELSGLRLPIPDYSTLSRRGKSLKVSLGVEPAGRARHVLVDSTGIRVIGEGEWKRMRHGEGRCQVWRKLHLVMDTDDQTILSAKMTESVRLDGNYLPGLINEIAGEIDQITGDGAYDKKNCYQIAYQRGARGVFPPQHDAIVQRNKYKKDPALEARDEVVRFMHAGEDRKEQLRLWKQATGYHRRSLVETMMSRMKTIFGDQMRSRCFENQETDLLLRCIAINQINSLGMPISEAVDH